ncbi:hypothetical protein D7Y60_16355 [Stenotrophomonas maltophilia]|jgi:hypothetical protein|nr:hypothetical protein [Stenotrophomonas maltophilia]
MDGCGARQGTLVNWYELEFTISETMLIESAWSDGTLDWNSKALLPVRSRIRGFHRVIQNEKCCYCRKWFADDHALAVDIEHVLPKSRYRSLAIKPINLSVACKRCNMHIKKDRVDFIVGALNFSSDEDIATSSRYSIVHPNIDVYRDHIDPIFVISESGTFVRYTIQNNSRKGAGTVEYFELRALERDTLNQIQGLSDVTADDKAIELRRILGVA